MADEVIIGNVGGEQGVASEATLAALLRAMEKLGGQQGKKSSRDKTQELANKAIAAGTTGQEKHTSTIKDNADAVEDATDATKKFGKSLSNMALAGIGAVMASLGSMTAQVFKGSSNVEDFAKHIPIAGSLFGALGAYLDDSMKSFRKLSMSGASFNNDLTELRRTSADLSLNLDEFTGLVGRNTDKFAAIGGTATQGVQQIARLNKALGEQREQLLAMGMSQEDVVESLTNYAYITRAGSRAQQQSQQQTAEQALAAASYAKNLSTLSKLTGEDVKSMEQKVAAQQLDVAWQMRLARMAPAERDKAQAALAQALAMGGETGAEYFKQQMMGIGPVTERTALFAATMGDSARVIGDMTGQVRNTSVSLAQFNSGSIDRFADFVQGAANAGQSLESVLATASAGMDGPGKEIGRILLGMGKQYTDYLDQNGRFNREKFVEDARAAAAETDRRSASVAAMASFDKSLRDLRAALQKAFIDSGILDLAVKGVQWFANTVSAIATSISSFVEKIKSGDIFGAITALFTGSAATLGLVAAITALFLGKAAIGAMTSAVGGVAGRLAGGLFGGGGGGAATAAGGAMGGVRPSTAGAGFGAAFANISKGIGTGIGEILEGLAKGLAAFANPRILGGAVILGASITAIGAGIAGAAWILGKLLPTFAEGLKAFADIDGSNLIRVGAGIAAVGVALAAMGTGSVIGAVGGVLTNLIEALPGKSLFDRLKDFSNMDLDSGKVKANAEAVVAYSQAMSELSLGGITVGAIGGLVTAAAEGLASFFGGSTTVPWDKVQAFQNIDLNAAKIRSNAEAVTAFGQAMSALPATSSGERTGGLIESVAGFFIGSKSAAMPWDQLVEFGNLRLPTASIKANAEAMAAFGEALSKVPEVKKERTGGLMSAVSSFFNGESVSVLPWAQLETFGNLRLPTASIKANAEAMAAFGEALSKVPEIRSERSGGLMGAIASFFGGSQIMPWDKVAEFGNARINGPAVESNARAMTAFGNAITAFQGGSSSGRFPEVPTSLVTNLERFGRIGSEGLTATAQGLQAIANTQNLTSTLTALNGLDASKLLTYNNALKELTRTLENLNKELANQNRGGMFGSGDPRTNAGDILRNISVNTSAGAGSTDQLNSVMTQVLEVLRQMKDLDDKIEKNTKNMGGSDISSRNVTVM